MKYQIYLNKETSELVEKLSHVTFVAPATFIKRTIEEMFAIDQKTYTKILQELEEAKNGSK